MHSKLFAGVLLVLGCSAYSLPWLLNPGSGLSFGAYDLAEWTSLHPAVRSGNLALLTTLLLRLPLACWGLIIGVGFLQRKLGLAVVILTGIAVLPPLEFFTQYRDDPNYQQQFFLAMITVAVGMLMLSIAIISKVLVKWLIVLVAITGAVSSLAGLLQGYGLLEQSKLATRFGLGGIGLIAVYAVTMIYFLRVDIGSIK